MLQQRPIADTIGPIGQTCPCAKQSNRISQQGCREVTIDRPNGEHALLHAGFVETSRWTWLGTAHPVGTLVTGSDPTKSVVDAHGKAHGIEGRYVSDGTRCARATGRLGPTLLGSHEMAVARVAAAGGRARRAAERTDPGPTVFLG